MSQTTQVSLRVIFIVHLVLSVWATIEFQRESYVFMNAFVLAFGMWAIVSPESVDAIYMYMVMNVVSIVMDIILISIYASEDKGNQSSTHRFSLGMSILNLILKPVTSFILYRLYQDRTGESHFPNFPPYDGTSARGYDTIDQPVYASHHQTSYAPVSQVETATPHSQVGKRPLVDQ